MTISCSRACSPDSRSSFLVNFRRFETEPRQTLADAAPRRFCSFDRKTRNSTLSVTGPKLEEFRSSDSAGRDYSTLSRDRLPRTGHRGQGLGIGGHRGGWRPLARYPRLITSRQFRLFPGVDVHFSLSRLDRMSNEYNRSTLLSRLFFHGFNLL